MTNRSTFFRRGALLALGFISSVTPSNAPAAVLRVANTSTAREFLAGDAHGTAVTSEGRLTLGVPLGDRVWPEDAADAVIFSAASDRSGRVFIATGGGLGRLFVSEPDGRVILLATVPEPNITVVAIAPDGSVVCGSSPNGKLYRVDPRQKSGTPPQAIGDPKESAIWSLAFAADGTLYAGTGNKGRIYRQKQGGAPELFHEIEDIHVRTLLVAPNGIVYAGSADKGLVVAISPAGVARTIHDFSRPEVVGIVAGKDGTIYAAATSAEAPSLGSAPPDSKPRPGSPVSSPAGAEAPKGTVTVTTGPPRTSPAPAELGKSLGAEVVSIASDGFVEPAWILPDETIYSLRYDSKQDELSFATGPRGRVYLWHDRHLKLEQQTDQKQVVAAFNTPEGPVVISMNSAGVFRRRSGKGSTTGSFLSSVKDAGRISLFSRLRFEGDIPQGSAARFSVRAGNSEKPDATWTPWAPLVISDSGSRLAGSGTATLPIARFFQWKTELSGGPGGERPTLERVELAYLERNARPILENVSVLEPAAVFPRPGMSGSAVLSVTSPDENGIFAGLETPRDSSLEGPGKKLYRKGFRTITWKGSDPNGDSLRYDLEARLENGGVWFPLRRDLEEMFYSFDATALPDGRYRFRVSASDRISNPEGQALTATDESALAVNDNTPPVLTIDSKRMKGDEFEVRLTARDALSSIARAEYSVNADRWRLLSAEDGAFDSPTESFVVRVPHAPRNGMIAIRVVDGAGNVAALSVDASREAP